MNTKDRARARAALRASFGMWSDRPDMVGDSTEVVRALREEWAERERRLGLVTSEEGKAADE